MQGSVSEPGGSAIERVRVSLAGEDFWAWAATGADGTFEIAVPEGSSGSALVSVHAGETAACRWLGYHDASGGLTVGRLTSISCGGPWLGARVCRGVWSRGGLLL